MKLFLLVFLIFICSFNLAFAIPTTESLFRNGDNKTIKNKHVIVKFSIVKKSLETETESVDTNYLKLIIDFEKQSILIEKFSDQSFKKIVSVRMIKNWEDYYKTIKNYQEKLIHSSFKMLIENSSSFFNNLFKSETNDYFENALLLNLEKIQLYKNYAKYLLLTTKFNKEEHVEGEQGPISPLAPEGEEDKVKVKELKLASMYKDTGHVTLLRNNKSLYWSVEYSSITALFFHKNHRLNKFSLSKLDNDYRIILDNYTLFDGIHELPRFFQIVTNNLLYQINFKSLRYLDLSRSLNRIYSSIIKEHGLSIIDQSLTL